MATNDGFAAKNWTASKTTASGCSSGPPGEGSGASGNGKVASADADAEATAAVGSDPMVPAASGNGKVASGDADDEAVVAAAPDVVGLERGEGDAGVDASEPLPLSLFWCKTHPSKSQQTDNSANGVCYI